MSLKELLPLVLKISLSLIVFSIGLSARFRDVSDLFRRPGLLIRSLLAMNVIMPFMAVSLAVAFKLRPALEIALVALAVSPVPPVLPKKEVKAGGDASYVIGLLVVSGLLSIVFIPAVLEVLGRVFHNPVQMPMGAIAKLVATSVLAPIVAGMIVGRLAAAFAARIARPLSTVATIVLLLALLPILIQVRQAIVAQIGDFTLVAIIVFSLVGLLVGHLLGGPRPDNRTALAISTATRHPGVAMAIAKTNVAEPNAVVATILLCVIVGAIATAPYVKWRKRSHAKADSRSAARGQAGASG